MCVSVCRYVHISAGFLRGQKRTLDAPGPELQVLVSI